MTCCCRCSTSLPRPAPYTLHATRCTLQASLDICAPPPAPSDDAREQVGRLGQQVAALQERRQRASDMEKLQYLVQDLEALLASEEAARRRAQGQGQQGGEGAEGARDAVALRRALSAVQDEVAVLRAEHAQAPSLRTKVPQTKLVKTQQKSPATPPL